jgi:hypothetical protein
MRKVPARQLPASLLSHRCAACVLLLSLLLYANAGWAQTTNGSITGRVTDPSKATIAEAKVAAVNLATNFRYESTTTRAGEYALANLPPGTYQMEVEKSGFKKLIRPDVTLHVQDALAIDFEMAVGPVTQVVPVQCGAPLVDTTSSALGGLVNHNEIEDLPLNGRNYIDLSLLQAGVTESLNSAGTNGFGGMIGTIYSANGAPVISNNFLLDGTQITNQPRME